MSAKTETTANELPVIKIILIISVALFLIHVVYQDSLWTKVDNPVFNNLSEDKLSQLNNIMIVYNNFLETIGDKSIIQSYEIKDVNEHEKLIKTKSYSRRQYLEVKLKLQSVKINNTNQKIWCVKKYKYSDPKDKSLFLTELLAETMKSRDYKSYYQILSQKLKQENTYLLNLHSAQVEDKNQLGMYEWFLGNSCLGVSIVDYEIEVYENSYIITYCLIDSIPTKFFRKERVTFKTENNKLVIATQYSPHATWLRKNEKDEQQEKQMYFDAYINREYPLYLKENDRRAYNKLYDRAKNGLINRKHYDSAKLAMQSYTKAMLAGDYLQLVMDSVGERFNSEGLKVWSVIKITDINITKEDIREYKAFYQLEINLDYAGQTQLKVGKNTLWLYLLKTNKGWVVEGLKSNHPNEHWWNT